MARPISVVSTGELVGTNEAELEAFIQSLLAAEEEEEPLPIVDLRDPGVPPAAATPNSNKRPPERPSQPVPLPAQQVKQKRPYRCAACGAALRGHQCVAFRPHEGKKRRPLSSNFTRAPQPVSTDKLLASMGTPEGKYDVNLLDSKKLKRFVELLDIWRRRKPPESPTTPSTSVDS